MPTMYPSGIFTEAGGFVAYGPSADEQGRLSANAIDRVLKGAKPPDIPVQQPTTFDLDINLKVAQEIGVKIPQSILLRANRVIK